MGGGVGGGGGVVVVKALLQLANFTLGPDATLNTEINKNSVRLKGSQLSQCIKAKPPKHEQRNKCIFNAFETKRKKNEYILIHLFFGF